MELGESIEKTIVREVKEETGFDVEVLRCTGIYTDPNHVTFYPSRTLERLKCRMPTAEEASILNIARNQPVVEMHRWVWGKYKGEEKEVLYEYSRFICNASLHEFEYTYDIEK
ncbi:NUDIX domain-containing protein [Paenactinomyces guangxiensis]|uniref:NUDIX domain-containing protein n=1 Tax=Paenactinomyces guangxiensis TaxID=1490290 RepID=UPI001E31A883